MDKKSLQLGMNFSTASARLDRQVLFTLVKECGRDTCYRCGEKIERWENISTEHKEPWQDVDPALFWDLDNVAFSHKKCNTLSRRIPRPTNKALANLEKRKNFLRDAPEDMAWCSGHQDYHPVEEFAKDKHQENGYRRHCKVWRAKQPW